MEFVWSCDGSDDATKDCGVFNCNNTYQDTYNIWICNIRK